MEPVADVLAALRAQQADDELAGEGIAMVEFRLQFGTSARSPRRSPRRRRTLLTSPVSVKAAATAAVAVVSLGAATATAAFAGALPEPLQQFAHHAFGAPAPHHSQQSGAHHVHRARRAAPTGPNAQGHTAYGLCNAYEHAAAHGHAARKAVAFRNLVKAAGGADRVRAFCAAVPHPGNRASAHAARAGHHRPHHIDRQVSGMVAHARPAKHATKHPSSAAAGT
jgi:hypothetical protein